MRKSSDAFRSVHLSGNHCVNGQNRSIFNRLSNYLADHKIFACFLIVFFSVGGFFSLLTGLGELVFGASILFAAIWVISTKMVAVCVGVGFVSVVGSGVLGVSFYRGCKSSSVVQQARPKKPLHIVISTMDMNEQLPVSPGALPHGGKSPGELTPPEMKKRPSNEGVIVDSSSSKNSQKDGATFISRTPLGSPKASAEGDKFEELEC